MSFWTNLLGGAKNFVRQNPTPYSFARKQIPRAREVIQPQVQNLRNQYVGRIQNPVVNRINNYNPNADTTFNRLGQFAEQSNQKFFGGLTRVGTNIASAVVPSQRPKIQTFANRIAPVTQATTPAGRAGAKFGEVQKGITEFVGTLPIFGGAANLGSQAFKGLGMQSTNPIMAARLAGLARGARWTEAGVNIAKGSGIMAGVQGLSEVGKTGERKSFVKGAKEGAVSGLLFGGAIEGAGAVAGKVGEKLALNKAIKSIKNPELRQKVWREAFARPGFAKVPEGKPPLTPKNATTEIKFPSNISPTSNEYKQIYAKKYGIRPLGIGETIQKGDVGYAQPGATKFEPTIGKTYTNDMHPIYRNVTPQEAEKLYPTGTSTQLPVKNAPQGVVPRLAGAGEGYVEPKQLGIKTHLVSGAAELRGFGKSGGELAGLIKTQQKEQDILQGGYQAKLNEAMRGIGGRAKDNLTDVLEGKAQPLNDRVATAATKVRAVLDEIAGQSQKVGLEIRTPQGSVPFKPRADYFPRKYNLTELQKGKNRQKVLEQIVAGGQAKTVAEADKLFQDFIQGNTVRRAGNIEYARLFDMPGYERDPAKAVSQYIATASKRLTEAKYFGMQDELANGLIDNVRKEGGDSRYAQEVFDLIVGNKQYDNKAVSAAMKFNILTKLDLGFVTNLSQVTNTVTKTGVVNTLSSLLDTIVRPRANWQRAVKQGAVEAPIFTGAGEGFSMGEILSGIMTPFRKSEEFNRVVASGAGGRFTKQIADKLVKNPNSAYAIRQLKSLGIEPEKIITQGGVRADDILAGAKGVSDTTQFTYSPLDVPPSWKTNIGKLLAQFKSFGFQQSVFVRDEVLKEAGKGNVLPMLRLIAIGVPLSYAVTAVRSKITGRNLREDEKSLDVRKLDYYLKAIGTMPTDLITQGQFLASTYKNPYATPLKKISRTVSSVGGPTVSEVGNLATAFESAGAIKKTNEQYNQEKDPYLETKRIASGWLPFVGEAIKNKVFAYPATYAKGSEAAGKQITQQIKDIKAGKKVSGETPVAQMVDGSYRVRIGAESKYFDTEKKAQQAIAKDAFKKSDKNFQDMGDYVLRTDTSGEPKVMSKVAYTSAINNNKLQLYESQKDFKSWITTADQQTNLYIKQLLDPNVDELDKMDIEEKIRKLLVKVQKYKGYGGFTKGKSGGKGKKGKVLAKDKSVAASIAKIKALKSPSFRVPNTSSGTLSIKVKAPKISASQLASWR